MNIFCDECKKNIATVFLTKISGSEVSKVQLCEDCARKMEEATEAVNLLAFIPQMFAEMQEEADEQAVDEVLAGELMTCDFCGTSFTDFQKLGFLGCARCYETFGEPLMRIIMDFQDGVEHEGKMPEKASREARLRKRLLDLERDLDRQIAEEQYESAAMLRDRIRKIKDMLEPEADDSEG